MEKPDQSAGRRRQNAVAHTVVDVTDELLRDRTMYQHAAGHFTHAFTAGLSRLFGQADVVDRTGMSTLTAGAAGVLRTLPDSPTFVIKLARRHRPAVVDSADDGVVTD